MLEETELNIAAWVLYEKGYADCSDAEKERVVQFCKDANEKGDQWEKEWTINPT